MRPMHLRRLRQTGESNECQTGESNESPVLRPPPPPKGRHGGASALPPSRTRWTRSAATTPPTLRRRPGWCLQQWCRQQRWIDAPAAWLELTHLPALETGPGKVLTTPPGGRSHPHPQTRSGQTSRYIVCVDTARCLAKALARLVDLGYSQASPDQLESCLATWQQLVAESQSLPNRSDQGLPWQSVDRESRFEEVGEWTRGAGRIEATSEFVSPS